MSLAFLDAYRDIRQRLGVVPHRPTVPRIRITRADRLYVLDKYPEPIGPRRLVMAEAFIPASVPQAILADAARQAQCTVDALISRQRRPELIRWRAIVAHKLLDRGLTYTQVGRFMGGRDHSGLITLTRRYDRDGNRIQGVK